MRGKNRKRRVCATAGISSIEGRIQYTFLFFSIPPPPSPLAQRRFSPSRINQSMHVVLKRSRFVATLVLKRSIERCNIYHFILLPFVSARRHVLLESSSSSPFSCSSYVWYKSPTLAFLGYCIHWWRQSPNSKLGV